MQKSKKVRVVKCTSQELFIVMCNVKNKLLNKVDKGKRAHFYSSPTSLFQVTEGCIPQGHDKIKAGKGGGYSLKNFPLHDLGHKKLSCEVMRIIE